MAMRGANLQSIVAELASRPGRESVCALIRSLLADGLGVNSLDATPDTTIYEAGGGTDVFPARIAFDFKSDLRVELLEAEEELGRYLAMTEAGACRRPFGIATDGDSDATYELRSGKLSHVASYKASPKNPRDLVNRLRVTFAVAADIAIDS